MNLFFSISSLIRKQTAPVGTSARHPFHLQSTLVLGLAYTCSPKVSFVTLGLPFKTFFFQLWTKQNLPPQISAMLRLRILRNLKESSSSSEIIFCLPVLCAHDAIDDKVGATIEDKSKVLEGSQSEHPAEGKVWLKGSFQKSSFT